MSTSFHVYLLTPRAADFFLERTYVGFTTNPAKRLRQHNKEIKGGARKTSKLLPWDFVCHVSGFPSQVAALQFEWMWQHPSKSKRSRELIQKHVIGKRNLGRIGTVKRKLVELSWLLSLEQDANLSVRFNLSLFGDHACGTVDEFHEKLGTNMQELVWPKQVGVIERLPQVTTTARVGAEEEEDFSDEVSVIVISDDDDEEEEEQGASLPAISDLKLDEQVIDLVTPEKPRGRRAL